MSSHTTLIVGGARSGKSRHASLVADSTGLERILIATARAGDDEMAKRIDRHKADRPAAWRVIEEPLDLAGALALARAPSRVVVVDCLTLWLSNIMEKGDDIETATMSLARELAAPRGQVILVSNEVGFGIVPTTPLGRAFRDEQGLLNQSLARACERVVFILAGLPLQLKPWA